MNERFGSGRTGGSASPAGSGGGLLGEGVVTGAGAGAGAVAVTVAGAGDPDGSVRAQAATTAAKDAADATSKES